MENDAIIESGPVPLTEEDEGPMATSSSSSGSASGDARPDPLSVVRTAIGYGGVYPFMLAAAGIGAVNRRMKTGLDFMMSTYPGFALAAGGVEPRVTGVEHLWSTRPAVFIFNHRNMIDGLIVANLLQRDFTSVAKKQLADAPLIGPAGRAAGVVFIDRENAESAIKSLQEATAAFDEGTSIIISPEGTRQDDTLLGPFKKGAFRLAMAGDVPIVPIVFHNAEQIQGASGFLMKPGIVDVDVLEPIPTRGWTVKGLPQRIESVRNQMLAVLERGPSTDTDS
jgi:putative phosphoserine phosphatase/1-acylglycerol-3-phosphate O-acyltransferase